MQIILTEEEYNNLKFASENVKKEAREEIRRKYSETMANVFKSQIEKHKLYYEEGNRYESYQRELYKIILLFWDKVKEEIDKPNN